MTEMNNQGNSRRGTFGDTVSADLASGRAVDLAELYALDAVTEAERSAIDHYISSAPDAERATFKERVRQARETLAETFTAEEEPPSDLFARIVAQLPAQGSGNAQAPDAAPAAPLHQPAPPACQRQATRHIRSRSRLAVQPRRSRARLASA